MELPKKILLFICAQVFVSISSSAQRDNLAAATIRRHLDAVSQRRIVDIEATVADSVTLIFPDGEVLRSKQAFVDFHADWFKDKNWEFTPVIKKIEVDKKLAYAWVQYTYAKFDSENKITSKTSTHLLLIFVEQGKSWKLIYDQNTRISI